MNVAFGSLSLMARCQVTRQSAEVMMLLTPSSVRQVLESMSLVLFL